MSRSKTLPITSKVAHQLAGPDLLYGIKNRKGLSNVRNKTSPDSVDKENPPQSHAKVAAINTGNTSTGARFKQFSNFAFNLLLLWVYKNY